MSKTKKKTRSKKSESKTKPKIKKTKKRYLIRELTALIEKKPNVTFLEARKLARQIKPDTSYNETYHLILIGRVKSHMTPKKKKKKK